MCVLFCIIYHTAQVSSDNLPYYLKINMIPKLFLLDKRKTIQQNDNSQQ